MSQDAEVTIVHLTDLHVGRQFNDDRWTDFVATCTTLKPDVVVVCGDLVDNPFRWRLAAARAKLRELEQRVDAARRHDREAAPPCRLIVVPGNHDTRITGLMPLARWRLWLLLQLAVVVAVGALGYLLQDHVPVVWVGVAAIIFVVVDLTTVGLFGRFAGYFSPEEAITRPTSLAFGGTALEVFPFDSASYPIYLAGGEVPTAQFVSATHERATVEAANPYRIAVVHHHPVPVPYDNPLEETMILRNAGAFLSELARLRVRLILHGHKHHWNFARITVNAETPDPHDIGVLAGTTVTRGRRRADGIGYGFNVLIAPAVSSFDVDPNRVDPEKAQSLLKKMLNVYRQRVEDSKKLAG